MARSGSRSSLNAPSEIFFVLRPSGIRKVGYDNERGKGDHRHFEGVETDYVFRGVEQLMADFWSDVWKLRGGGE